MSFVDSFKNDSTSNDLQARLRGTHPATAGLCDLDRLNDFQSHVKVLSKAYPVEVRSVDGAVHNTATIPPKTESASQLLNANVLAGSSKVIYDTLGTLVALDNASAQNTSRTGKNGASFKLAYFEGSYASQQFSLTREITIGQQLLISGTDGILHAYIPSTLFPDLSSSQRSEALGSVARELTKSLFKHLLGYFSAQRAQHFQPTARVVGESLITAQHRVMNKVYDLASVDTLDDGPTEHFNYKNAIQKRVASLRSILPGTLQHKDVVADGDSVLRRWDRNRGVPVPPKESILQTQEIPIVDASVLVDMMDDCLSGYRDSIECFLAYCDSVASGKEEYYQRKYNSRVDELDQDPGMDSSAMIKDCVTNNTNLYDGLTLYQNDVVPEGKVRELGVNLTMDEPSIAYRIRDVPARGSRVPLVYPQKTVLHLYDPSLVDPPSDKHLSEGLTTPAHDWLKSFEDNLMHYAKSRSADDCDGSTPSNTLS